MCLRRLRVFPTMQYIQSTLSRSLFCSRWWRAVMKDLQRAWDQYECQQGTIARPQFMSMICHKRCLHTLALPQATQSCVSIIDTMKIFILLYCIFATSPINSTECYVIPWLAFYNLPILEPATALCGRYDSIFLPQWASVWKLCTKQEFPGHFFTTTQSFLHRKCALISQNKA